MTDTMNRRPRLGLPWWAVLGLAALALPRVVLHDLGIGGGPVQGLLTFGPPAVWIWVALRRRVPSPLLTLGVIGGLYGIGLGAVHLLMWDTVFADAPRLGGRLDGALSSGAEGAVFRVATGASSVLTGVLVGLVSGGVAVGLRRLGARRTSPRRT